MKLWIGARLDSDIDADVFRIVRNDIESSINQNIQNIDYGDGIVSWDIVLNIFSEGGKDLFKFNKKSKETNIELWIVHSEFKSEDIRKKRELIYNALLKSIDTMQQNSTIQDFNFNLFKEDISKFKNNIS
jgi:Immunity protein 44